jgi:serine/threonine-protein kinase
MTLLEPGTELDHYRIDACIATSGMASIFRAIDLLDGRQVAIKVPHPEMECDTVLFERFSREERIGRTMDHPGVMKVLDGENRSRVYMVMEWVPGRLLRQVLNESPQLPIQRAVHITLGICDALEYIHTHGVVHRDLKPENIMVDEHDNIKLIDFGIASNAGARRLTFANFSQTLGTPDYISPEQVKGKRGDERSDLFSLGVILYEMVTGKTPYTGGNPFTVMNDRLVNTPRPPHEINAEVSPQLQEIIYRALERDPRNRYPSAHQFAFDLAHQELVGVAERAESRQWQKRRSAIPRKILFYTVLALIPVVILLLMFYVARHG